MLADTPSADAPMGDSLLQDIPAPDSGNDLVVLVPASLVTLAETDVPTRNRTQLLKAVPYALEEELAGTVEELHFAVGTAGSSRTLVAVIRRDWFEEALTVLERHGFSPNAVVPETLCLPWSEDEWTVLLEERGGVVRTGRQTGFGVDPENLEAVIDAAVARQPEEGMPRIRIFDRRREGEGQPESLAAADVVRDKGHTPSIVLLAATFGEQRPVNLLQGEFSKQPGWREGLLRWRIAAALFAAVVGTVLIDRVVENFQYADQRDELDAAMTAVYKATFPDAVRIINPEQQMRNRLAELREQRGGPGVGFLDLVVDAGPLVASDRNLDIKMLRYRDGRMELDLDARTIEQLEALQQRLKKGRLNADLKAVRNEGDRFLGRIVITGEQS